jgi:hypothetical protein
MSDKVIYREYWHKYISGESLLVLVGTWFIIYGLLLVATDSKVVSAFLYLIIVSILAYIFRNRCDLVTITESRILVRFLLNKSKDEEVYSFSELKRIRYVENRSTSITVKSIVLNFSRNRTLTLGYDVILKRLFEEEYSDKIQGEFP